MIPKISQSILDLRFLDEQSRKMTFAHHIHPFIQVLITFVFIACVTSYGPFALDALWIWGIYPVFLIIMGEVPLNMLKNTMKPALLLILTLGIFNPLIDQRPVLFMGIMFSAGLLSYLSLIIKGLLTVSVALCLLATTGIDGLAMALRLARIPSLIILQLLMTYRYIIVLAEEMEATYEAYTLRAPGHKGIHFKAWGGLMGQIALRTIDRAERIYEAMLLRGFQGAYHGGPLRIITSKDWLYCIIWLSLFVFIRFGLFHTALNFIIKGVVL